MSRKNRKATLLLIAPVILHPKSIGNITLKSKDPEEAPLIYPEFLTHPDDMTLLLKSIRLATKLVNTKPFKDVEAKVEDLTYKRCPFKFNTDEYWKCAFREVALPVYHPSGTCKMGAKGDPLAVVDERVRVQGVKNLRVADASIMPVITSGNTHAPSIMIGEKAAELIMEDNPL